MRTFTQKALEQIFNIYNNNFNSKNEELVMALFMQLFSYNYDDRIEKNVKFKNILDVASKVWVSDSSFLKKTNEQVGIPIFLSSDEEKKYNSFDKILKTEYILNEIRGSIVHGNFNINDDGTITIRDKYFYMTFEFDCIVDICNIISNEFEITDVKNDLFNFCVFLKNISKNSEEYNREVLDKKYKELKIPILLFNLLPMNEDDIHNNPEYIDYILRLINKKQYYKKGILKNDKPLEVRELYKVRNCIAHCEYYFTNGNLVLYDHDDIFEFDCNLIEKTFYEYFGIDISKHQSGPIIIK